MDMVYQRSDYPPGSFKHVTFVGNKGKFYLERLQMKYSSSITA
jgi:hypothetical protein